MIGKLKSILTDPKNIKFAAFLSSLAAGFKVVQHNTVSLAGMIRVAISLTLQLVNSILYYLPLPRDVRLLLAGNE